MAADKGRNVAIIADIPGPKLRLGKIENNRCTLVDDEEVLLCHEGSAGTSARLLVEADFFDLENLNSKNDFLFSSNSLSIKVEFEDVR